MSSNALLTAKCNNTANVVDCNDAGSQHFSRGTESPVPELLVSSDA